MNLLFKERHIIKLYKWISYEDIPLDALIPFTDAIIGSSEEKIFKKWEDHFQGRSLSSSKPYVVTINPKSKKKILWVEKTVEKL